MPQIASVQSAPPSSLPGVTPVLSPAERRRLAHLERVIDRGRQTFMEVGLALKEIRDRQLYRQTHSTFTGYCSDHWNFTHQRAYQLISAAAVVEDMPDVPNERAARLVAKIVRDRGPRVARAAVKRAKRRTGRASAASIKRALEPAPTMDALPAYVETLRTYIREITTIPAPLGLEPSIYSRRMTLSRQLVARVNEFFGIAKPRRTAKLPVRAAARRTKPAGRPARRKAASVGEHASP